MNTAKSEKKRVRNRKKHRDESGRFSMNLCKSAKSNNVLKSASANLNGKFSFCSQYTFYFLLRFVVALLNEK